MQHGSIHSMVQSPLIRIIYRFNQAKSEALDNIKSLVKQDIKSCNAKWHRQQEWWKNNNRSNEQKSNFAHAAHFFVHFFAIAVFHNYNVKLLETSRNFLVTCFLKD